MNFKKTAAAYKLQPYTGTITIGKKSYNFKNNSDVFKMLYDDKNVKEIKYGGRTFKTTSDASFEFTEVVFQGVFSRREGNVTYYWINIYDIYALNEGSIADVKPLVYEYESTDGDLPHFEELVSVHEALDASNYVTDYVILDDKIVPKSESLIESTGKVRTVSVTKVSCNVNDEFYNVIGSTKDPLPGEETSWVATWEAEYQAATGCEANGSSQHAVRKDLVGGHVTFNSSPASWLVPPGGQCYLTPICRSHNADRNNTNPAKTPMKSVHTQEFLHLVKYFYKV
ncbi:hypothetical protein [Sphingobacterium psychroaquaticum]|uniref:Uncharacterized protein n=1 Tax=Sphingobacterium psychroaquaticum TaxID=561061 RepID=A0A1X7JWG3_9SPHI|nr:hypothetical protein [Sphingobacterium psychroaquaticum]SMG32425.1 hypothetical protein SAMN05660862_2246 [Sphingobacterium psychroaquaticum]